MISIIQIFATVFALFAWSRALLRYKDRKISNNEFIFWSVIWLGVVVVAFIPGINALVSDAIGIRRPIDFFVYLSIILLFYLVFRIYIKLDTVNGEITKIVREFALRKKK